MSILILGIETSCDETAAAVVADGRTIISNIVASQVDIHARYGGVIPEVASRRHIESLNSVIAAALSDAGVGFPDLDAVAVTCGPGLLGSLLVGLMAAKSLAFALDIPLIAVNHVKAHIYANFLNELEVPFPFVALVVSGGHTDIVYASGHSDFNLLGQTRDDAAGETFDKVARYLGLGYPGGPLIEQSALHGKPDAIPFPRAILEEGSLDTSFSGLKTAVVNYVNQSRQKGTPVDLPDLTASFQAAVVDVLVGKACAAAKTRNARALLLAGGVSSNGYLRMRFSEQTDRQNIRLIVPPPSLCTDNAAMVAAAGYFQFLRSDFAPLSLNADANLPLGQSAPD
ncbi:MAG: tRNA (adenosine(37)-N6)-threonylcarbamoyltransferase complex transferase subunit TsaD [Bacillota bacterium]